MTMQTEGVYYATGRQITLVTRKVEFCCEICKKPGKGPANMRVHPGKCRAALIKINAKLAADRRKRRKIAVSARDQVLAALRGESLGDGTSFPSGQPDARC